jgi:hypothetical protein
MTRLWSHGDAITVSTKRGLPISFIWQDREHLVASIAKRWRVDEGWWRHRVWRECFKLATDTDLLVVIYRDLVSGEWYLQRLYD